MCTCDGWMDGWMLVNILLYAHMHNIIIFSSMFNIHPSCIKAQCDDNNGKQICNAELCHKYKHIQCTAVHLLL